MDYGLWTMVFNAAYAVFAIFYLPVFLVKIKQASNGRELLRQRLGILPQSAKPLVFKRTVWLHTVSVGEVMAIRKFVTEFLKYFPGIDIILTTVTPTGQKVAKEMEGGRTHVFYFPFDFSFACRSFFETFQPECLILAETEIWPNLLLEAEKAGVPAGLINARLSEKSSRRYHRFQRIFKPLFQKLDFVLAQSQKDAERFLSAGVEPEKIKIPGNMKYDQVPDISQAPDSETVRREWRIPAGSPVVIAGSTHPGEEEILFRVFSKLKNRFSGIKMILAPRHIERAMEIRSLGEKLGFKLQFSSKFDVCHRERSEGSALSAVEKQILRRSASQDDKKGWDILILDQIGILKNIYQIADAVFVGGSLVPKGGQNPIEPAAFRRPVLHGPYIFNFEQVYEWLDRQGGSLTVTTEEELWNQLERFLANPAERGRAGDSAFRAIQEFQGATARHLEFFASQFQLPERIKNAEVSTQLFPPAGGRV